MIGYHYTNWKNWKKIKKEGIKPYLLDGLAKDIIKRELGINHPKGIWIWRKRQKGLAEIGTIIARCAEHDSLDPVLLRVELTRDMIYGWDEGRVDIEHNGTVGKWKYHTDAKAIIIRRKIPQSNIRLVKRFNLFNILK
ncbi:MAG: hypothetical protein A2V69_01130 [Candidatus Portnoybacteria bacterium RBG_13_40_8]|uniref:Uncharacterized protein n=1 Tax=Candidatus Portnoybacteria bacterium RBG_13_40_8 TaxID=1801990 RepID=A0A1G2F3F9_9BACT|nr:MAG: hypothetical protein A2V69_01130 [Candidatus Portnoybacteria bacterium RBG_13_40_8]